MSHSNYSAYIARLSSHSPNSLCSRRNRLLFAGRVLTVSTERGRALAGAVEFRRVGMKRLIVAALMAGVASGAMAADLPSHKSPYAPAPMYVQPAFTWTVF